MPKRVDAVRSPYEYLVSARERYAHHGGAKSVFRSEGGLPGAPGTVCMIGAVREAVWGDVHTPVSVTPRATRMVATVADLFGPCLPEPRDPATDYVLGGCYLFNDKPETTMQDVLDVYDCAIEKAAPTQEVQQ